MALGCVSGSGSTCVGVESRGVGGNRKEAGSSMTWDASLGCSMPWLGCSASLGCSCVPPPENQSDDDGG